MCESLTASLPFSHERARQTPPEGSAHGTAAAVTRRCMALTRGPAGWASAVDEMEKEVRLELRISPERDGMASGMIAISLS